MQHRSTRLAVAFVLTLCLSATLVPVAVASPLRSLSLRPTRLSPLAGGLDMSDAVLLTTSPVSGSLDAESESGRLDDVYKIYLNVGEMLTVSLTSAAANDYIANVYRPGAASVWLDDPIYTSWGPAEGGWGYPQTFRFVAGTSGYHYVDVGAYGGSGAYTMTWSKGAPPIAMSRYAGSDRNQTAIQISQSGWGAGTTRRVILATGRNFADALAASALAGSYDCPILLTERTTLPSGLLAEIDRLRGSASATVTIVGASSAVDTAVADALDAHGLDVQRIAGADRYATAVEIGKEVRRHEVEDLGHAFSGQAFVCLGSNFPDALAASPFAARMKMPVLLVKTGSVPQVTHDAFAELGITKAYSVGGTGTISASTHDSLPLAASSKTRLYGANRFATAGTVANYALAHSWASTSTVGLATGRNFPDALGGGPAIGKLGGVMLLTEPDWLSEATDQWVYDHGSGIASVRVFGGHTSVSDYVFTEVLDAKDGVAF